MSAAFMASMYATGREFGFECQNLPVWSAVEWLDLTDQRLVASAYIPGAAGTARQRAWINSRLLVSIM